MSEAKSTACVKAERTLPRGLEDALPALSAPAAFLALGCLTGLLDVPALCG